MEELPIQDLQLEVQLKIFYIHMLTLHLITWQLWASECQRPGGKNNLRETWDVSNADKQCKYPFASTPGIQSKTWICWRFQCFEGLGYLVSSFSHSALKIFILMIIFIAKFMPEAVPYSVFWGVSPMGHEKIMRQEEMERSQDGSSCTSAALW